MLEAVADWLATEERSGGISTPSSLSNALAEAPASSLSRMSPDFYQAGTAETSESFSTRWRNLGIGTRTGCLTLNGSEWPSDAAVSSLSQVLEIDPDMKYSLSPRACAGILSRAARRGRRLPEPLQAALEAVAATYEPETETAETAESEATEEPPAAAEAIEEGLFSLSPE